MGIVSATGRGGLRIEDYEDFIQTDAPINPGNSGGAMVDLHGDLIGINTAILSGGGGGNEGIGFAIPINMARSVMDQIVTHGKVVRGYLGVYIGDLTPVLAKQFGLNQPGGALINDVTSDTPGSRAGLKRGDVILRLNGQAVDSANSLRLRISQTAPGTSVKLGISREGKSEDINVTLGELPADKSAEETPGEKENGGLEGVNVQELTPEIAKELQMPPGTNGVVVGSVDPSSGAAAAGIERGDVIQEVNHKPIHSITEYKQALAAAGKQPVLLLVNEGGATHYVVIESR
jgi:serine protease Do